MVRVDKSRESYQPKEPETKKIPKNVKKIKTVAEKITLRVETPKEHDYSQGTHIPGNKKIRTAAKKLLTHFK